MDWLLVLAIFWVFISVIGILVKSPIGASLVYRWRARSEEYLLKRKSFCHSNSSEVPSTHDEERYISSIGYFWGTKFLWFLRFLHFSRKLILWKCCHATPCMCSPGSFVKRIFRKSSILGERENFSTLKITQYMVPHVLWRQAQQAIKIKS